MSESFATINEASEQMSLRGGTIGFHVFFSVI